MKLLMILNDRLKLERIKGITRTLIHLGGCSHMIERIPIDKETENKAVDLIKEIAKGDSAEAMGFRYWLDDYKKNKK
jgi:hypothetical protein